MENLRKLERKASICTIFGAWLICWIHSLAFKSLEDSIKSHPKFWKTRQFFRRCRSLSLSEIHWSSDTIGRIDSSDAWIPSTFLWRLQGKQRPRYKYKNCLCRRHTQCQGLPCSPCFTKVTFGKCRSGEIFVETVKWSNRAKSCLRLIPWAQFGLEMPCNLTFNSRTKINYAGSVERLIKLKVS